jgi:hypothetical protein
MAQPGSNQNERTTGELGRLLDSVISRLEALIPQLDQTYLRKDLFETEKRIISDRLDKIESRGEWIVRTVGGLFIAAIFSAVIAITKIK